MEDPRIITIDGTHYMTYTGYNSIENTAQLCMATSHDLVQWDRQGVLLPAYRGTWNEVWTKSDAIVPQKINGRWWMYYLGTKDKTDQCGLAVSDDLIHWKDATDKPIVGTRPRMFADRDFLIRCSRHAHRRGSNDLTLKQTKGLNLCLRRRVTADMKAFLFATLAAGKPHSTMTNANVGAVSGGGKKTIPMNYKGGSRKIIGVRRSR